LNFKNKEGFGLFYFFCRTNGLDKFDFDKLKIVMNDSLCNSAEDVARQLITAIGTNPSIEEVFLMPKLLGDYDRGLRQKYLVILYRYASLTAKADGTVNDTEAEWLSKILNLSQKPSISGNVVISNNEEKETKAIVKQTRHIRPKTSKLKSLIGLTSVKEEIETLANFIKIQQQREAKGMKTSSVSYHCVFTGNPGTGKTTVARIVADIYKSLGILAKGHLVETDRSGLVAEYVGQTAVKTNKIIDSALDGVLFIDEAYSLISNSQNDYGKEAIAILLKRMEDNRDRLVVILAGYSVEMQQFIDSNPGLQSRFNRYIEFPDYSAEELYQIFEKNAKEFDYKISKEAEIPLKTFFANKVANKDKNFGNARFVRNLFEKTIERQANRLSKEIDLTNEKLSEICTIDIPM
jgi:AAA+ superfamily predicted ATPase